MVNKKFKIIFITGHRKSGTSLVHRLFDGHPDICDFPADPSVFYAYFGTYDNLNISNNEKKKRIIKILSEALDYYYKNLFTKKIRENKINKFLIIFKRYLKNETLSSRSKFLYALANSWIDYKNKKNVKFFLIKETSQVSNYFNLIKDPFVKNQIKFICIIRNPLDNFSALYDGLDTYYKNIGENFETLLTSFLLKSRVDLQGAKILNDTYPNNFISIRFEDIILKSEHSMKKLCKFVGLSYQQSLLNPTLGGKAKYVGNNHKGHNFNNLGRKNINNWKNRIDKNLSSIIELYMSDLMEFYNYKLTNKENIRVKNSSNLINVVNSKLFFKDAFK